MRIDRPGLLAHLYFCVDRIRCFFSKMSLRYVRKRLFPQDAARVYSFILLVPRFATFAPPHVLESFEDLIILLFCYVGALDCGFILALTSITLLCWRFESALPTDLMYSLRATPKPTTRNVPEGLRILRVQSQSKRWKDVVFKTSQPELSSGGNQWRKIHIYLAPSYNDFTF